MAKKFKLIANTFTLPMAIFADLAFSIIQSYSFIKVVGIKVQFSQDSF